MNIDNNFLKINMNLKMIIFILLKFICFDKSVVIVGGIWDYGLKIRFGNGFNFFFFYINL